MNCNSRPCKSSNTRFDRRFRVHAIALAILGTALLSANAVANSFTFVPASTSAWNVAIDGGTASANKPLTLFTGQTYTFNVTASSFHPFFINTVQGTGSANAYVGGGLSANGATSSTTLTFNVPADAPNTLFYNCGNHSGMTNTITVVHDLVFRDNFEG
jgi:hypothetical protein